jgi:hypothetical protein
MNWFGNAMKISGLALRVVGKIVKKIMIFGGLFLWFGVGLLFFVIELKIFNHPTDVRKLLEQNNPDYRPDYALHKLALDVANDYLLNYLSHDKASMPKNNIRIECEIYSVVDPNVLGAVCNLLKDCKFIVVINFEINNQGELIREITGYSDYQNSSCN